MRYARRGVWTMLRPLSAALILVACVAAVGAASGGPAAARERATPVPSTAAVYAISGRGWGHGVGMSQWGAYGFAQRGFGYARIVTHYYPGTSLGRAPVSRVRVLLVADRKTVTVASDQPLQLRDGLGQTYELPAGSYGFGPGFRINVDATKPQPLPGPLLFTPSGGVLRLNGKRYRGSFEAAADKGTVRVVNVVGLEAYLYGVVPDEVPHTWPAEALKAQAVVARSYALAQRKSGAFDLYDDTRSQVYNGIDAEEPQTNAAVNATAGQVLLYNGRVATAYFFSTSGGRTANVVDVWGSNVPYLVSVPDPYDDHSPHHAWGPYRFTAATLAKAIGVRGRLLDVRTEVNASARVDALVGVGTVGESRITGSDARRKLGLRSTWFRVGVLSLEHPTTPVPYGGRGRISGVARDLAGTALEQRVASGAWQRVAAVTPGAEGRFAVAVKPATTTQYRLANGPIATPAIQVAVAPLVKLAPPRDATALRGTVTPAVAGLVVSIQRKGVSAWVEVARAATDPQGAFEARLRLVPGTYRARVVPGRGFAAGVSAVLDVVPQ